MRARHGLLIGVLLASWGAASLAGQGASEELQGKADLASGAQCSRLSMQAARQEGEDAKRFFEDGDRNAARHAVDLALGDVRHAVDCALDAHKSEKNPRSKFAG